MEKANEGGGTTLLLNSQSRCTVIALAKGNELSQIFSKVKSIAASTSAKDEVDRLLEEAEQLKTDMVRTMFIK